MIGGAEARAWGRVSRYNAAELERAANSIAREYTPKSRVRRLGWSLEVSNYGASLVVRWYDRAMGCWVEPVRLAL